MNLFAYFHLAGHKLWKDTTNIHLMEKNFFNFLNSARNSFNYFSDQYINNRKILTLMIKLVAYLDSDTLKTYKLTVKNQFFKNSTFLIF